MTRSPEPSPHVRKLREYQDTITVTLTQEELEAQRARVCELRDRQNELDEKFKTIQAEHKARVKEIQEQERVARKLVSTKRADIEVTIAEWLQDGFDGIQVVRVRTDTGDMVGEPRKATAAERQEAIPL